MTTETTNPIATLPPMERAANLLNFDETKVRLVELAQQSERIKEVRDTVSRDECHAAMMVLKGTRVEIEKRGKEARDDANKFAKAVITKEDELIDVIRGEETRLRELRDAWDAAREAERQAALKAEEDRIRDEQARLDAIHNLPLALVGKSAARIFAAVEELSARDLTTEFPPASLERAQALRIEAMQRLHTLHDTQTAAETERAENERLREQQRAETERREAEEKAAREREAALALEREHVEDILSAPLRCIGATSTRLVMAIEDIKALTPAQVIATPEILDQAKAAQSRVVEQLQQMLQDAEAREAVATARIERERQEAEAAEKAEEQRRRAQDEERLAELRARTPTLLIAATAAHERLALLEPGEETTLLLGFAIQAANRKRKPTKEPKA